jgi:hypothetical protein
MHIEFVVPSAAVPPPVKRNMYNLERMYKEAKYVSGANKSLYPIDQA